MKSFDGAALLLDRNDINTDEIIPARYLTESTKEALKPHLLEDLKLDGFEPQRDLVGRQIIISRANFGCGSSREHAPWALEQNGIHLVVAISFARIFRQNMFNCGLLALTLEADTIQIIFEQCQGHPTQVQTDLAASVIHIRSPHFQQTCPFNLSKFDRALVEAGGWVEYADLHY